MFFKHKDNLGNYQGSTVTLTTLERKSPDQGPLQVIHGSKASGPSENDLDDRPKKKGLGNGRQH